MKSFVPDRVMQKLPALHRTEADTLGFGVINVDDAGIIQLYNKYESELSGYAPSEVEGKNFFTQVAPCTNNRLFYGRFKDGVTADSLDVVLPYTFTYKMRPTNVYIQMYRDGASKTNWVFVKKR